MKTKLSKCRVCKAPYQKYRSFEKWCSPDCGAIIGKQALEKKKRIEEKKKREEYRAAKEQSTPVKELLKIAEKEINLYVRLRDYYAGCISCDKPSHYDGKWNASHYKSVGSNSVLRFNLWNINKGCVQCNMDKSGNIAEYRPRLVLKIGGDKVEWLECQNGVKKYTSEYLLRLIAVFRKKNKRMKLRMKI